MAKKTQVRRTASRHRAKAPSGVTKKRQDSTRWCWPAEKKPQALKWKPHTPLHRLCCNLRLKSRLSFRGSKQTKPPTIRSPKDQLETFLPRILLQEAATKKRPPPTCRSGGPAYIHPQAVVVEAAHTQLHAARAYAARLGQWSRGGVKLCDMGKMTFKAAKETKRVLAQLSPGGARGRGVGVHTPLDIRHRVNRILFEIAR